MTKAYWCKGDKLLYVGDHNTHPVYFLQHSSEFGYDNVGKLISDLGYESLISLLDDVADGIESPLAQFITNTVLSEGWIKIRFVEINDRRYTVVQYDHTVNNRKSIKKVLFDNYERFHKYYDSVQLLCNNNVGETTYDNL